MFFTLSKIFWIVAQPINLIGILAFLGIVAALFRLRKTGLFLAISGFLVLALGRRSRWRASLSLAVASKAR